MAGISIELWIWYTLAMIITFLRIVHRVKERGRFSSLQLDDYLIILAVLFYTVENVGCYYFLKDVNEIVAAHPSPQPDYAELEKLSVVGHKMALLTDQTKITAIWLVKGSFLTLYLRITARLWTENIIIRVITIYVILSFIAIEVLFYAAWCRPFSLYWLQLEGDCHIPVKHLIVEAVFNLSSDMAMLAVMLTIFLRSSLPLKKKLYLCGVFGLGIFIIFCAAASKYENFTDENSTLWVIWYGREIGTAVIVANLPLLSVPLRWLANSVKDFSRRFTSSASSSSPPLRCSSGTYMPTRSLTFIQTSFDHAENRKSSLTRQDTIISVETPKDTDGVKLSINSDARMVNVDEIHWIAPWTSEEYETMEQGGSYFNLKT